MAVLDTMIIEHHLIRDFIDKVQVAVEVHSWGEKPPAEIFEKAVEFAETYIETFHHVREEEVLFPRLLEKLDGSLDKQFERLNQQHIRSHVYITEMQRLLEVYKKGSPSGTRVFFSNVSSYLSFVRAHLNRENHLFFPIIESELTENEQQLIMRLFDDKERELGEGYVKRCHETLAEMTDILEKNYGKQYRYLLDAVHSKRVDHRAA